MATESVSTRENKHMIRVAKRQKTRSTENIWRNNRHSFSEFTENHISQDPKNSISFKCKWYEKDFTKSHQNQMLTIIDTENLKAARGR